MATLLPPPSTSLQKSHQSPPWLASQKRRSQVKCNATLGEISEDFLATGLHIDQSNPLFPVLKYGLSQYQRVSSELPEIERWEILVIVGLGWAYLTARPGVLAGAIDAYILAPLQLGIDGLLGRRNLKMDNFIVGEKLGEGSFGVVYSGVIVPKNVSVEERVGKRGKALATDARFKERVILKKASNSIFSVRFLL